MRTSRTISLTIYCDARDAYDYIRDPVNLAQWASGLGSGATHDGTDWIVETPSGRAIVRFAPENTFGVLDHEIVTADGTTSHVPMRVVPNGDGCDVLFTLFQPETVTEREFSRDVSWVRRDLEALKDILEAR